MGKTGTACIVQARMGSTRLPGKSLLKVYRELSLLEMVLRRCARAGKIDIILLATSKNKDCDPLEELAAGMDIPVVRGSEGDVLARFDKAIDIYHPDNVVRVCADNPLVSPEEIDKLVDFFIEGRFDYAANSSGRCGLPDGLGCEIVRSSSLKKISEKTKDQKHREHVTAYILDYPEEFRIGQLQASPELCFPEFRLDIDTGEDLKKMQKFCQQLPSGKAPYWSSLEIVELSKRFFAAGR